MEDSLNLRDRNLDFNKRTFYAVIRRLFRSSSSYFGAIHS